MLVLEYLHMGEELNKEDGEFLNVFVQLDM